MGVVLHDCDEPTAVVLRGQAPHHFVEGPGRLGGAVETAARKRLSHWLPHANVRFSFEASAAARWKRERGKRRAHCRVTI